MKPFTRSITGIPYGILSALMVTAALFLSIPLLTLFQPAPYDGNRTESVFIPFHKQPPPPSETRDVPEKQSPIEKDFVKKDVQPKRVRPTVDIPRANILGGDTGGIHISIAPSMETVTQLPDPTYRPEEVDQQPTLIRSLSPQYPFLARRDNIEGWVMLRFVVEIDGSVKKVEVASAEPVGFFEEAALRTVERYKFKPAIKNGKAVSCFMTQRIRFGLD